MSAMIILGFDCECSDKCCAVVCCAVQAATDCLTTVSWVSRFSAASRSGGDGVIVSFVYEALTDPEGAAG